MFKQFPTMAQSRWLTQMRRNSEANVVIELERTKPELKKPRVFRVVLLNDDYTPMEFVVHILQHFFNFTLEKATHLMMEVHTKGRGVCGVFYKEIAESKVAKINTYSRTQKHPLLCVMEPDENATQ